MENKKRQSLLMEANEYLIELKKATASIIADTMRETRKLADREGLSTGKDIPKEFVLSDKASTASLDYHHKLSHLLRACLRAVQSRIEDFDKFIRYDFSEKNQREAADFFNTVLTVRPSTIIESYFAYFHKNDDSELQKICSKFGFGIRTEDIYSKNFPTDFSGLLLEFLRKEKEREKDKPRNFSAHTTSTIGIKKMKAHQKRLELEKEKYGLIQQLTYQRRRLQRLTLVRYGCVVVVAASVGILAWSILDQSLGVPFILVPLVYALTFILAVFWINGSIKNIRIDNQSVSTEIEILSMNLSQQEKYAEKLYKINNNELKRYYNLSIQQSYVIFFVAVFCIFLGLGIPGVVITLFAMKVIETSAQVTTAVLGGISSLLSTFVAAVLIKISGDIGTTFRDSLGKLVETNKLLLANVWLSKIRDKKVIEDSYKKIAKILASK